MSRSMTSRFALFLALLGGMIVLTGLQGADPDVPPAKPEPAKPVAPNLLLPQ